MRKEQQIVEKLIKKYKTSNPFELCDRLNVDVRYADLGSIRGMYRYTKKNTFITLNSALNLTRMEYIMICAHELGHLLLHKDENRVMMDRAFCSRIYKPSRYENEANRFALYLLMKEYKIHPANISLLSKYSGFPMCYIENILV